MLNWNTVVIILMSSALQYSVVLPVTLWISLIWAYHVSYIVGVSSGKPFPNVLVLILVISITDGSNYSTCKSKNKHKLMPKQRKKI